MASKTTYTCDRCKQESDVYGWLNTISVSITRYPQHTAEWCDDCVIALGVVLPSTLGRGHAQAPQPAPTIEDMIREIVRSEIQQ